MANSTTSRMAYLLFSASLLVQPALAGSGDTQHDTVTRGDASLQSHGEYIDRMIADFVSKNQLPGIAMAIVQAPYIPRSAGYGRINLENDELASTKTIWNIGPITQAFTAVAILQLKEMNKLDVNAAVSKYVPNLPAEWRKVSLLELLQHSSGIPDYRDIGLIEGKKYSPTDLIDLVRGKSLLFKSGTEVRQSATNFALLGLVIEHASGMSYQDFITRYQIRRTELSSTMFSSDLATKTFLDRPSPKDGVNQHSRFESELPYIDPIEPATGYVAHGSTMVPVRYAASASLYAFGSLWSSADDISKWDIALAGSTLVRDKGDRDLIYTPSKLANGAIVPAMAGWEFTHHPGFMEIKGYSPGFSSYLSRFTAADELVCVTLLTDKQGVDFTQLARAIADAYKSGLGADVDPHKIVAQESKFDVAGTVARLKTKLAHDKVEIFATFDHAANAHAAGLELRPTEIVVFGNAKVGTKVMQDKQVAGLDLPLRIMVWQDARNRTWIGYTSLDRFVADYDIDDHMSVAAMSKYLETTIDQVADVYTY
jgi:CubicO group peptidase (beta-lactamase class C family)/uncharacterized protein (DUF302 family)